MALLLEHLEAVRDARRAHERLRHPPVGVIPWEAFQTHAPMLLAAWEAGFQAGRRADTEGLSQENSGEIPRRLAGGSLNQHAKGYWRAFRKVAGKSRCVYLGSRFNLDEAREKLQTKNAELGVTLSLRGSFFHTP